jgi:hypothetical protein
VQQPEHSSWVSLHAGRSCTDMGTGKGTDADRYRSTRNELAACFEYRVNECVRERSSFCWC